MSRRQLFGYSKRLILSWSNNHQRINRCLSTKSKVRGLECLENRCLLQVSGTEVSNFIQGLITNDMRHFDDGADNIYAIFLNVKGRVLFDTIIYKGPEENFYFIECDTSIVDNLRRHLMIYKLRKKIDIIPLVDKMKVWALFEANLNHENSTTDSIKSKLKSQYLNDNNKSLITDDIVIYKDPRIPDLSNRILTQSNVNEHDIIKKLNPIISVNKDLLNYKEFRYRLGIGEGAEDLPPGKPLPLEANCDFLHGISFHKGCYIGQELTARTHHTGVVRKRLMPLILEQLPQIEPNYDDNIVNENDKSVGKLRGITGQYGLGLMRIIEAINAKSIKLSNVLVKTEKPFWWPLESRSDKINLVNNK